MEEVEFEKNQHLKKIPKAKAPELVLCWNSVLPLVKQALDLGGASHNASESDLDEDGQKNQNDIDSINTCIPNGFQLLRTLGQSTSTSHIQQILHIPNRNEIFGTLDPSYAHLWFSESSSIKISVSKSKAKEKEENSVPGLDFWQYCKRWKVIIATTSQMDVKILNLQLKVISSYRLPFTASCLEFNDDLEQMDVPEIIIGSVASIVIYSLRRTDATILHPRIIHVDKARLTITEIENQEWISCLRLSQKLNLLYAAHDTNISIFDYNTGKLVIKLNSLHDEPISAIALWELHGYLITGGKDAKIRVWNSNFNCLYEFKEHFQTITSLEFISVARGYIFLISTSKDSNIKMWDLDAGVCVNKINTSDTVNGMKLLSNGTFCTFSNEKVSIWTLSKVYIPFAPLQTALSTLRRIKISSLPSKILGFGSNGSILILSPRTGETLLQAYPSQLNFSVLDVVYDPYQGYILVLYSNGNQLILNSAFSPCIPFEEWVYPAYEEKVICVAGLPAPNDMFGKLYHENKQLYYYLLICGTNSGQIVYRDIRQKGMQVFLMQAHFGLIRKIFPNTAGTELITISDDKTLKLWKIVYTECKSEGKPIMGVRSIRGFPVSVTLELITSVHIPVSPEHVVIDADLSTVGLDYQNALLCYYRLPDNTFEMVPSLSFEDRHIQKISFLAYSSTLELFATASMDGNVKIWDRNNSMVREIQFNEELHSVEFANARGDLLVAMETQVVLVKLQDYLPRSFLEKVALNSWEDDPIEEAEFYNLTSNFWRTNRYNQALANAPFYLNAQLDGMKQHLIDSKKISQLEALIMRSPEKLDEMPLPATPVQISSDFFNYQSMKSKPVISTVTTPEIRKKSRIYDESETTYIIPEMSLEKLIARDYIPDSRNLSYVTSSSGSRTQSAEAIIKLEARRKKKIEKDEEMRRTLLKDRSLLLEKSTDLPRPNALGQQPPSLIFKKRKNNITVRKEKLKETEGPRLESPKYNGNRYEVVVTDQDIFPQEEVEGAESLDSEYQFSDYHSQVSASLRKKKTLKKRGSNPSKKKKRQSLTSTETETDLIEVIEEGEDEEDDDVFLEIVEDNANDYYQHPKYQHPKSSFVVQRAQETSSLERKAPKNAIAIEKQPKSFTIVDGSWFETEFLFPETFTDDVVCYYADDSHERFFSSEIADPANGFVTEEQNRAHVVEKGQNLTNFKKKKDNQVKKSLVKRTLGGQLEHLPNDTVREVNDLNRPPSPEDPSFLLSNEEKSTVAWSLFKAAIQKSIEKSVNATGKELLPTKPVCEVIPSKKEDIHSKKIYNCPINMEILKGRGAITNMQPQDLKALSAIQEDIEDTVSRRNALQKSGLNQFRMDLDMKIQSDYYFGKGFKRINQPHQKESAHRSEKNNDVQSRKMDKAFVITNFDSIYEQKKTADEHINEAFIPMIKVSAKNQFPTFAESEGQQANILHKIPPHRHQIRKPVNAKHHQRKHDSFMHPEGKIRFIMKNPSTIIEPQVFTLDQLNPSSSLSQEPQVFTLDQLNPSSSLSQEKQENRQENLKVPQLSYFEANRSSADGERPSVISEKDICEIELHSKGQRLSFVKIHTPLFLDQSWHVPIGEYQSVFTADIINSGNMVTALQQATDWFDDFAEKQVTISSVLLSLADVIQSRATEKERIDAAMGARFLMETFRKDMGNEGRKNVEKLVEMQVDTLLSDSSDPLKVQLIKNIGASRVTNDSVMEALIVTLASDSMCVRTTALEVLGEFGVTTPEELENRMNMLQMFPEIYTYGKERFVHPLDPFVEEIQRKERERLLLSLEQVRIWSPVNFVNTKRPDSSHETLVPRVLITRGRTKTRP